jgi:hypothetical protein
MKKTVFRIFIGMGALSAFILGFFVTQSYAQLGALTFGGRVLTSVPCTCSANTAILYVPTIPTTLIVPVLTYNPYSTVPFSFYNFFTPGVKHVGNYLPGVQACWISVVIGCVPIPTQGLITQMGSTAIPVP